MLKKLVILSAVLVICTTSMAVFISIGPRNVVAAPPAVEQACDEPGAAQNPYCEAVDNPPTKDPVTKTIGKVVTFFAWLAGICAVIWIIYGGFRFVTSYGDSQKVAAARETILYAVIGLVVIVASYSIITLIINRLTT